MMNERAQIVLSVQPMTGESCRRAVMDALLRLEGVRSASVDIPRGIVRVDGAASDRVRPHTLQRVRPAAVLTPPALAATGAAHGNGGAGQARGGGDALTRRLERGSDAAERLFVPSRPYASAAPDATPASRLLASAHRPHWPAPPTLSSTLAPWLPTGLFMRLLGRQVR